MSTNTNYTSSDYNGFLADPDASYSFAWNSPPFDMLKDYVNPLEARQYATLMDYSEATGQDEHSILVDYDIFVDVDPPDYLAYCYQSLSVGFPLRFALTNANRNSSKGKRTEIA